MASDHRSPASDRARRKPRAWPPIRHELPDYSDWVDDLVAHTQDLLCVHDLEGKLLSVNPAPARLLGYTVDELLGIPMRELAPARYRARFDEYLQAVVRDGEARGLLSVVTRSGQERIWEYHNTLRTEGVPAPVVRGMAHDVTERVLLETELREAVKSLTQTAHDQELMLQELKLFRTLLDHSNDAIEVIDPATMRLLDVNQKECVELGYTREELLAMRVFDIDPKISQESVASTIAGVRRSGFVILESLHRRKDGTTFPVELNIKRVQLDREYMVAISRDISERRQAEERLREYEKVVEGLEEMIVVVDRNHRYVLANRAFLKFRGMEKEQLLDRSVEEILNKESLDVIRGKLDECFTGKAVQYEIKYHYPKLGARDLLISYLPIEGANGVDRAACVLQDVTDRKIAEEALRRRDAELEEAQRVAHLGSWRVDVRSSAMDWSEELYRITGLDPKQPVSTFPDLQRVLTAGGWAEASKGYREFLQNGGSGEAEVEFRRGDGTTGWVLLRGEADRDESGQVIGLHGGALDITERKRMEEELRLAKEKLSEEKLYLEQEIGTELGFEEIVGKSAALHGVMEKVGKVAPSGAAVLLLGETGTGKELVARALHRLSQRAGSGFIKMNCAAIPSGLLESELFGHEKGAFTGAVARKIGRLELADQGTLFLDEVGEIPLMLQPKLLRVLQDMEFERLGGTQTIKVDFRLIAATNRDLAESVRENEFRSDLYYRLNVFPIRIPPLRERRDDIRLLVEHFVQKIAKRMNKIVTSIPKKTIDALMQWGWPGNVRELENFIERSVILTRGSVLEAPLSELSLSREMMLSDTLADAEREHILRALRESHGKISGPGGAAERLGLKRTTLQSKLRQMGIDRWSVD